MAGFVPADIAGEMTSIGTLFVYAGCAGVWIMRVKAPELERDSRPGCAAGRNLGIITCGAMIYGPGGPTGCDCSSAVVGLSSTSLRQEP